MKGIDVDKVFSVLIKIMKKVQLEVGLINMNLNGRARLKSPLIGGLKGEIVGCMAPKSNPHYFRAQISEPCVTCKEATSIVIRS